MTVDVPPEVRFEVLGPLRARIAGDVLNPGPVQTRVLLAVLLLQSNQPVSRERLIDEVWGENAPAYAVNLVQKHVSSLRRVLEPRRPRGTPSTLLTWTDGRYLLAVPPGGLDLHDFERATRRARSARAAGDLLAAAETLHAALALWRGPLCDGLTSPLLDAERDRLTERRFGALEERLELDLELGRHRDVIAELQQLTAEHPLREPLHGLFMLALNRAGRQADALAAYQQVRRRLVDELGVEPGPELRRLHTRLLTAETDPEPFAEAAPPVPAGPPAPDAPPDRGQPQVVPAQLPHGPVHFIGRDAQIDRLRGLSRTGPADPAAATTIITLTGMAGVGKSALALHWAHQIRDDFPDGQLYVNLRGFDPGDAARQWPDAVRGFLDAFGVPAQMVPVGAEAQAALYRSLLAGRRVLVVLDNARDSDHVRPLLPGASGSLVIVTSRDELTGLIADGARPVVLDPLTGADARRLLARRLGPERVTGEPGAVDQIVAACAGLPLALSVVAARAATRPGFPLTVLADSLAEARGSLDAFDHGDRATDVRTMFSWSYGTLRAEAARLFRLLGLHPGPDISVSAAASLAGARVREVTATLAALTKANLVEEQVPHRFGFHDLLRAYAAEQVEQDEKAEHRDTALRRMVDHYSHTAYAADRLLNPHREPLPVPPPEPDVVCPEVADRRAAWAWFTVEYPVLLAVVDRAARAGLDASVCQLAWALTTFLDRREARDDAVTVQRAALAAALRLGDVARQAGAHRGLARALIRVDRVAEAREHLRQALHGYAECGDDVGAGRAHLNLAAVSDRAGDDADGLYQAQESLARFRAGGSTVGQADALNAIGLFHARLGAGPEALAYCEEALALHQRIEDRDGEAHTWDSLGEIHLQLNRSAEAVHCYQRALTLWRDLDDRSYEAWVLDRIGDIHRDAGDLGAAASAWRLALALREDYVVAEADNLRAKLAALPDDIPDPGPL